MEDDLAIRALQIEVHRGHLCSVAIRCARRRAAHRRWWAARRCNMATSRRGLSCNALSSSMAAASSWRSIWRCSSTRAVDSMPPLADGCIDGPCSDRMDEDWGPAVSSAMRVGLGPSGTRTPMTGFANSVRHCATVRGHVAVRPSAGTPRCNRTQRVGRRSTPRPRSARSPGRPPSSPDHSSVPPPSRPTAAGSARAQPTPRAEAPAGRGHPRGRRAGVAPAWSARTPAARLPPTAEGSLTVTRSTMRPRAAWPRGWRLRRPLEDLVLPGARRGAPDQRCGVLAAVGQRRSSPWCMSSAGPCPTGPVQRTSRPGATVTCAGQRSALTATRGTRPPRPWPSTRTRPGRGGRGPPQGRPP